MIHPPRIQAKIDANRPTLVWFMAQGLINEDNPILHAWALIDGYGVSIECVPSAFGDPPEYYGYFLDWEGDKSYVAPGLSALEAGLKTLRTRIEAEGMNWITEISRELRAG